MARLRVITWNVHGSARPRIDAVADLLRAHEPDVVALQEVRSGQARRISALLGWPRPAWAFKHNGYWPLWWRAEGLAVPGITAVLNRFHDTIADLQRRFLHIIALAVGCHEDFFERMLRHGPHLTRAIHYPAMDLAPGQGHVWAGEHGDINLITALPRASAPGLQVKTDSGWVDAVAPEGHVIINTGMMLEQLTNGVIPTGIHRVVSAPGHVGDRYSVVQFCHPTPWTILSPVPSCVSPEQPQRYGAIAAGDRLDEVLWEINLVEDGRRVS